MSEPTQAPAVRVGEGDDIVLPAVVYGLYLLGLVNGLTILVGVIIAYIYRDKAGARVRSHYVFQVRTCWMGLAIAVGVAVLAIVGFVLSFILVGVPILILAGIVGSLLGVWFAVRCIVGLYYLVQNQPYPRPDSWLV